MSEPIDLNAERNKRAQPDPELVKQDDYGRPLFNYGLSYEFGGSMWATELGTNILDSVVKTASSGSR